MYSDLFTAESLAELKTAFLTQFPMALWETFYVTVLSTALAILLGLPLGVLLVISLIDLGAVVPVWIFLHIRLKEIQGGEEDAAAEY